jgi:crotonobetaine/carnitine-CoA ligase
MPAALLEAVDRLSRTGTLGTVLADRAAHRPEHPFIRTRAASYTFRAFESESNRVAHGLSRLGVGRGSRVAVILPNRAEVVLVWFALAKLGAVYVPLNSAFKGPSLATMMNLVRNEVLITDAFRLAEIREVAESLTAVTTVVVLDSSGPVDAPAACRLEPWADLPADQDDPPGIAVSPSEPAMFLWTSGTTGRSKACMLSHRYVLRHAALMIRALRFTEREVTYSAFPLFYIDATVYAIGSSLLLGATAAIGERFSTAGFWDDLRHFGATNFDFVAATLAFLMEQPPSADDRRHAARLAWGIPLPPNAAQFEARFGVRLVDGYGLTEAGVPIWRPLDEPVPAGSCGRVATDMFDVRIVDESDRFVPPGTVGEIVIRPLEPSLVFDGYFGMPEATVETFRNLWLHTGDLGHFDPQGFFHFDGRKKDVIRRRGQNISAFEIEEAVNAHPAVFESAAFGVPSAVMEEDVKICVLLNQGARVTPAELSRHCAERLPGFMVPRYIEMVDRLPRTVTDKVDKTPLRSAGIGPATWDREAAPSDPSLRDGSRPSA